MRPNLQAACKPSIVKGVSWLALIQLLVGLSLGCSAPPQTAPTQAGASVTEAPGTHATQPVSLTAEMTPTATQFRLASPSPAPTSTEASRPPTATPTCQDGLRYLSDITVPDGSIVLPGEAIDKQWQVENSGTCNWNERYRLRRISGPALDAPDEQALYPARGGTQAVIQVQLVAPSDPGTYRSAWQAHNPGGEPFGDPIFVEILVAAASP